MNIQTAKIYMFFCPLDTNYVHIFILKFGGITANWPHINLHGQFLYIYVYFMAYFFIISFSFFDSLSKIFDLVLLL